jgi:hypothetical protein
MQVVNCIVANESGFAMFPREEIPDEIVNAVLSYQAGDLSEENTISLFQFLISSGLAWQLHGEYNVMAKELIEAGMCVSA